MSKIAWYLFALSALLILVVYWKGSTSITGAISNGLVAVGYAFTGRTPQGTFAAYPSG
jgi:hypothetical protein